MTIPDGYEVTWSYMQHDRHHPDLNQRFREEHEVRSPAGVWLGTFPTHASAVEWIALVEAGKVQR